MLARFVGHCVIKNDFNRCSFCHVNGGGNANQTVADWFDVDGKFHARGYLFEQPYTHTPPELPEFSIPDQSQQLTTYIVAIRDIEARTGVDFFPLLDNPIENIVEVPKLNNLWGETN